MKPRPVCPLCVSLICPSCGRVEQQINRGWIKLHNPQMKCRRHGCGATVGEMPVRHTNKDKHASHVEEYARRLLSKPVRRIERSPIDIAEALDLLHALDDVFFKAYNSARWLPTDDDRDRRIGEDRKAQNWNEGTADLLALVAVVRQWVAENTGSGD